MANPKTIILTGASRGIGLAIAHFLLKASHKVFLVARTEEPLIELKNEYPGQAEFLAADLADFKVRENAIVFFWRFKRKVESKLRSVLELFWKFQTFD
jgi:short-subunit dehydrogenase